jgi:hypothetical protein
VRWLRKRREAREARTRLLHDELRRSVLELMADYDCQIRQGENWIEVRGGPHSCPFTIWLPDDWVNLAAGDKSEYVLEWVLSVPGELTDLVGLLRRIVAGELGGLPAGSNNTRLEGYSGYALAAPPERSL